MEAGHRPLGREGAAVAAHRDSAHQERSAAQAGEDGFRRGLPRRAGVPVRHSDLSTGILDRADLMEQRPFSLRCPLLRERSRLWRSATDES